VCVCVYVCVCASLCVCVCVCYPSHNAPLSCAATLSSLWPAVQRERRVNCLTCGSLSHGTQTAGSTVTMTVLCTVVRWEDHTMGGRLSFTNDCDEVRVTLSSSSTEVSCCFYSSFRSSVCVMRSNLEGLAPPPRRASHFGETALSGPALVACTCRQ
jgi:hypothetical protein